MLCIVNSCCALPEWLHVILCSVFQRTIHDQIKNTCCSWLSVPFAPQDCFGVSLSLFGGCRLARSLCQCSACENSFSQKSGPRRAKGLSYWDLTGRNYFLFLSYLAPGFSRSETVGLFSDKALVCSLSFHRFPSPLGLFWPHRYLPIEPRKQVNHIQMLFYEIFLDSPLSDPPTENSLEPSLGGLPRP